MNRISVAEARELWLGADDEELKRLANEVRGRYHEPGRATYMVMRIVNYTNVCVAQCDYCAFYVLPNQEGGYVLDRGEVRIGLGTIDYGVFLAEHAAHAPDVPLMLEHLPNESEYDAARAQVMASGERIGLRFE